MHRNKKWYYIDKEADSALLWILTIRSRDLYPVSVKLPIKRFFDQTFMRCYR
jgi:hypothetical protein